MTQAEIIKMFNKQSNDVVAAVRRASEKIPSIKNKYVNGRLWFNTNFNLEETREICKELKLNELQIIYMEENFQERPETDVYTISGTNAFLLEFKKNPTIKCCNTCKFLKGKASMSEMPKPFCSLYNKYLESFDAKVYEDYCNSYLYLKLEQPRQWFKDNAPANLDIFGNTNTINGIKRDKMQVHRKRNEPIRYANRVGLDLLDSTPQT